MKIINKTLSGKISFRGLGFVKVNDLHVAICGSRAIECGVGSVLQWMDEQIEQVPPEPEIRATFGGTFDDAAVEGDAFFISSDKKRRLIVGSMEGLMLGVERNGNYYVAVPPLKLTFLAGLPRGAVAVEGLYPTFDVGVDLSYQTNAIFVTLAE